MPTILKHLSASELTEIIRLAATAEADYDALEAAKAVAADRREDKHVKEIIFRLRENFGLAYRHLQHTIERLEDAKLAELKALCCLGTGFCETLAEARRHAQQCHRNMGRMGAIQEIAGWRWQWSEGYEPARPKLAALLDLGVERAEREAERLRRNQKRAAQLRRAWAALRGAREIDFTRGSASAVAAAREVPGVKNNAAAPDLLAQATGAA
jgi:hypothetical protein